MSQQHGVRTVRTTVGLAAICLTLSAGANSPAYAYTGTLSSLTGGIMGTGNWLYSQSRPAILQWQITQDQNRLWHYAYTFTHTRSETKHFILEVCSSVVATDVLNANGNFQSFSVGTFSTGGGNPGMPGSIYGIKFASANGNTSNFAFDSYRAPVWKDFYSKGTTAGGHGQSAASNRGFTSNDCDPSESTDPSDGSLDEQVLSLGGIDPVPEPGTFMLLGLGLVGAAGFCRRKKLGGRPA